MSTRKDMKKRAKTNLKRHYWIFVIACLIAAFLGAEYGNSLSSISIRPVRAEASDIEVEGQGASTEDATLRDVPAGKEGAIDVLADILEGNIQAGQERAKELQSDAKRSENKILGRSRGVLAMGLNAVTSGTIYVKLAEALNSIVRSDSVVSAILVVLSMIFMFGIWMFLENMYQVVSRRIFLEGRVYEKLTAQRFLYLLRLKKWIKVSWVMFVATVFESLWWLTFIGGIIKHYSYYMVPYIVAENPAVGALEAVRLSRKMMKGHKWQCFMLELSFIGWNILGAISFGFLEVFYVNPYKQATFCEYYAEMRQRYRADKGPGYELLNDRYLFEKAEETILEITYLDVLEQMSDFKVKPVKRKGIRAFLANNLGIVLLTSKAEKEYEDQEARQLRIAALEDALAGICYPTRLSAIPEHLKRKRIETVNYLRHYTIWSLILMFFTFAFIGWVWEVSLHLISDGVFVNRGVLHGPWLPIYGGGGMLILMLLYRFRKNPALEFVLTVVVCGTVEYFTSWWLEMAHDGQKWWDYSGYFLNLNGRICAEGLLTFGLGGMLIVYVVAPLLDQIFKRMKTRYMITLCVILGTIFIIDNAYSGRHPNTGHGITDYEAGNAAWLPEEIQKEGTV